MIHRALGSLVALSALLSACQVQLPVVTAAKKGAKGDESPRTTTPKPGTGAPANGGTAAGGSAPASARPGLPGPSVAPALVLDLLQKPAGAATLVAGALRLDGGYIVAAGAGNIVAAGAGNIVAAGAGNILSHNGGQVLSHNGGQIVAAGAGNIISQNGGQIVAAGAGNLLSSNGGQLVAAGAGNILSHNGGQIVAAGAGNLVAAGAGNLVAAGAGNLVAAGAGNYGLFQAGDATGAEFAKVAGAEIAVRSLRTGAYLPVGVDGAGKPVYVVYTNLEGRYELYVPEAEQGNVMIEASVNRAKQDARLEYQNLSGVGQGIDEDVVLVTEVLRRSIAVRLRVMFRKKTREEAIFALIGDSMSRLDKVPGARDALTQAFGQVWDAANEVGLTGEADQQVLYNYAYAATDAMLREFDLDSALIKPGQWWDGRTERAIPALVQIVGQARVRATGQLDAIKQYPWFVATNERAVASGRRKAPWSIKRAADVGAMVIDEFIVIDPEDKRYDFSPPVTAAEDCDGGDCSFNLNAFKTALKSVGANGLPLQGVGEDGQPVDIAPDGKGEGPTRSTKRGFGQVDRLNQAQFEIILQMVLHLLSLGTEDREEILHAVRQYKDQKALAGSSSPNP